MEKINSYITVWFVNFVLMLIYDTTNGDGLWINATYKNNVNPTIELCYGKPTAITSCGQQRYSEIPVVKY